MDIVNGVTSFTRVTCLKFKMTTGELHSALCSGVARVLRAPVQRHVMGPLVTKQLRNFHFLFAATYVGPAGQ